MRLAIRSVRWPLALTIGAVAATAWLVGDEVGPRPPPERPRAAVRVEPPAPPSRARPATPPGEPVTGATLEEQLASLRRARGPDAALLLVAGSGDAQVRAMALTSLARHADDPRARGALVASLAADRPREERLLALTVLGGVPDRGWARPALEAAAADADEQVRATARDALRPQPGDEGGR